MRDHVVELEGPPGAFVFIRVFAPGGEDGPCVLGGFTGLGEPRKPAELVAEEAVAEALAFLGSDADLDCRLADQVLLPALLAGRDLAFRTDRVTEHLRTQAATIGHFLGPCVRVGADGRVEVRPPQAATARGG
jgi:RNA 3'-terminal phosphate cyclase (ATP)